MVLSDVKQSLHIRNDHVYVMHQSNDRPNIELTVRPMAHPANTFLDLAFLVPDNPPPEWKPAKFLVFFDTIAKSIRAAKFLCNCLPIHRRSLLKWFNSEMSTEFRENGCEDLKEGHTWALMCTDLFGMVGSL